MNVRITGITTPIPEETDGCQTAEQYIVWAARVSNPDNQANHETGEGLLRYCLRKKHWSPFDVADVGMEIQGPRDILRQILRHRSFCFQEFSQRYAEVDLAAMMLRECRMQDAKNRQSSLECDDLDIIEDWEWFQEQVASTAQQAYRWAMNTGVAKEVARVVLPEGLTPSTMIMKGSVRSWIHYCEVRRAPETQREHRDIAEACWQQLKRVMPVVCAAVEGVAL